MTGASTGDPSTSKSEGAPNPVGVRVVAVAGPMSMLGYARKIRTQPARRTRDWMRELREGEKHPSIR